MQARHPFILVTLCSLLTTAALLHSSPAIAAETGRHGGICGDSSPDPGEQCDDGNLADGDGCSAMCQIEDGAVCTAAVPGVFTQNALVNGSFEAGESPWLVVSNLLDPLCTPSCLGGASGASDGDAWIWIGGGSLIASTDVTVQQQFAVIPASATTLEFDWSVFGTSANCDAATDFLELEIDGSQAYVTPPFCNASGTAYTVPTGIDPYGSADTVVYLTNACGGGGCNDGLAHAISFHAVTSNASPALGNNIFLDNVRMPVPLDEPVLPVPSTCVAAQCGDGIASAGEACDDGNTDAGDGCSPSCIIEEDTHTCTLAESADDVLGGSLAFDQDVVDPGLESGSPNVAWEQSGAVRTPLCSQFLCGADLASDGAFYALFGGTPQPDQQVLRQVTTISTLATEVTFDLLIAPCDSAGDVLSLRIDGNSVYNQACTGTTATYQPQAVDLSTACGGVSCADDGVHTIEFVADIVAANGGQSDFLVDNILIEYPVSPDRASRASSCQPLGEACSVADGGLGVEKFEAGIPSGWTVFDFGDAGQFGTTDDGVCGTANWSGGNVTRGSGEAACADSDAAGAALMDVYLCTAEMDLSAISDPQLTLNVNYQTAVYNADEFLEVLAGTVAPDKTSLANDYVLLTSLTDHKTASLDNSPASVARLGFEGLSFDFSNEPSVWACFRYGGNFSWFAQIDNVALRGSACTEADADFDGVADAVDNCVLVANADQRDSNSDGIGNICDPDITGPAGVDDCVVNFVDLGAMKAVFFSDNEDADLDGSGAVNFLDLAVMKALFFGPPGPAANPLPDSGCVP